MCETTAKNLKSHPRIIKSKKIESSEFNPMTSNPNGVGYKTSTNGFYYNRRSNSINREINNLHFSYNDSVVNRRRNRNFSNKLPAFA
jgi:hypothetical protein